MKKRIDWFNVAMILALAAAVIWVSIILGRSPIGFALGADTTTVQITLPEKYYWANGVALKPKTDYRHTEVMYGPCSGDAQILTEVLGGTNIDATRREGVIFYVPKGRQFCAVATVIGLDRLPIGKSNPVVFSTAGRPSGPVILRF